MSKIKITVYDGWVVVLSFTSGNFENLSFYFDWRTNLQCTPGALSQMPLKCHLLYKNQQRNICNKCLCSVQRVIKQTESKLNTYSYNLLVCLFVLLGEANSQCHYHWRLWLVAGFLKSRFFFKFKIISASQTQFPNVFQPAHDSALMYRDKKSQNALFLRVYLAF